MKPRVASRPADAAEARADSGRGRTAKRSRKRQVDGRTREAKRWRSLHEHYVGLAGKQHDQLCRALATLIVQREALDNAAARGEMIDPLLACRLSGEIRRLLNRIGVDEVPIEDGTAQAIAAITSSEAHAP